MGTRSDPHGKLARVVQDIQQEVIEKDRSQDVTLPEISRQDTLISIITDLLLEDMELELSHATAEYRVNKTIEIMMEENINNEYEDPVARFRENWPELASSGRKSSFEIIIPIPVQGRTGLLPDRVEFDGDTLERIAPNDWKTFKTKAQSTDAEDTDGYPHNLEALYNATKISTVSTSRYTFWKLERTGIDADYLVQQSDSIVELLLGQLSFVSNKDTPIKVDYPLDQVSRQRAAFQPAPFYLIYRNDSFYRVHPRTYPVTTPIPRLRNNFNFESSMNGIPSLYELESVDDSIYHDDDDYGSVSMRPVEAQIGAAFRMFGKALRRSDPESMFLDLYRALEHITFTKYAPSKEPLERSLRLLDGKPDDRTEEFIQIVKNRRNTIVHDGMDVQITEKDLNLLKSLVVNAIDGIGQLSSKLDSESIIAYLLTTDVDGKVKSLSCNVDELKQELTTKETELEILMNIQDRVL